MSAPRTFYLGSRLPVAVDLGFYLMVGMGMQVLVPRLEPAIGHVPAFIISLGASVIAVASWTLQWRQRFILMSDGMAVSRGLLARDRFIPYGDLVSVDIVSEQPSVLEVRFRTGLKLRLAKVRREKLTNELVRIAQQVRSELTGVSASGP